MTKIGGVSINRIIKFNEPEKAIIVGVILPTNQMEEVEDSLDELELLTDTAGGKVVQRIVQSRERIDSAYYIGKGKAEYVSTVANELSADIIIFDDDLTPAQVRNLEELTGKRVIDRSELILDIFAQRARTYEAKLEVELAQLEYLLPRLVGMWGHLSRLGGGIGTRGPGETQLEIDRRRVRRKITDLKRKLKEVEKQHQIQKKGRDEVFTIALVGYTNAGKSTLMNKLTNADVLVENQLFSTLDTTTRKLYIDNRTFVLLSDTVGFIRKLPHHLITSFHTTLQEVVSADLLLHIVDISHPFFEEHIASANSVLDELEVSHKPTLLVFNKIDCFIKDDYLSKFKEKYKNSIPISAKTGKGINELKEKIKEIVNAQTTELCISVPNDNYRIVSYIYENSNVLEKSYNENKINMKIRIDKRKANKLYKFCT